VDRRFGRCVVEAVAQRLAINVQRLQIARFDHALHPMEKASLQRRAVERGKDATDGVVRRNAVGQRQNRLKPRVLLAAEQRHIRPRISAGDRRQNGQRQNVIEPMQPRACDAEVFQFIKTAKQTARSMSVHANDPWGKRLDSTRGLADVQRNHSTVHLPTAPPKHVPNIIAPPLLDAIALAPQQGCLILCLSLSR
jgi:hypothetical protein